LKTIEIEWSRLVADGRTCDRCAATGRTLRGLVRRLGKKLAREGVRVRLLERKLEPGQVKRSNTVTVGGVPLEEAVEGVSASESGCSSCSEILCRPGTSCRSYEWRGETHEAIPEGLLAGAVLAAARKP
jgi:Domain of unknown function (DUF2703)